MFKWLKRIFKKKIPRERPFTLKETDMKEGPIDMVSIVNQHKRRYKIQTTLGDVVMKHLGKMDFDNITKAILLHDVEWEKNMVDLDYLSRLAMHPQGLPEDKMDRYAELVNYTDTYSHLFAMACFASPEFNTREKYEAFVDSLKSEEYVKIKALIDELTSPRTPTEIEKNMASLCKAFHIPLSLDLAGDNMTVTQFRIIAETNEMETQIMKSNLESPGLM